MKIIPAIGIEQNPVNVNLSVPESNALEMLKNAIKID